MLERATITHIYILVIAIMFEYWIFTNGVIDVIHDERVVASCYQRTVVGIFF